MNELKVWEHMISADIYLFATQLQLKRDLNAKMSNKTQVVLSSDLSGELHNVMIWDLKTANTVMTYKSCGVTQRHCLDLIKDEFVCSSQKDTPIINVWSLESKDQLHLKMICPAKVNALKVTKDGMYCLVAINTSLYIWQILSGNLLTILSKHYQPITCIAIATDSSYFVTGGEDGLALVWSLSQVLSNNELTTTDSTQSSLEPKHKWSEHTNAITDIRIGFGGIRAHCMTSSTDQTCRIYELLSGMLMITIVFDTPLWSVAMDSAQYYLFVGGEDGNIYQTRLYDKPSHAEQTKEDMPKFVGHDSAVTCLSVSIDGLALISGSNDNTIKVWHICSRQCMRTIATKGPVSNLMTFLTPSGLYSTNKSKSIAVQPFKRYLINNSYDSNNAYEKDCIYVKINKSLTNSLSCFERKNDNTLKRNSNVISTDINKNEDVVKEVCKLKKTNEQMYAYALDSIFKSIP